MLFTRIKPVIKIKKFNEFFWSANKKTRRL